jgi:hypothetical protein
MYSAKLIAAPTLLTRAHTESLSLTESEAGR